MQGEAVRQKEAKMAAGLKYNPYEQPREFMDDIVGEMKKGFDFHVAEAQRQIKEEVAVRLTELDNGAGLSPMDVRMSCLALFVKENNVDPMNCVANLKHIDALAQYVLTGKKPGEA
jgi:hypothetical protein